jgi:8-oxo-dGTP pyrophosphatase MutT (NUDIX family)
MVTIARLEGFQRGFRVAFFSLRRAFEPPLSRLFHFYWRFSRGLTFGVRALVIDDGDRIFLVKHSYVSGWHLPGGGVEPGETMHAALARELVEEGNIHLTDAPAFHGLYFNAKMSDRDHVALFVVRSFCQPAPPRPDHEIIAHGFFAIDGMPGDTSAATRARVAEVLLGAPASERW